MHLGIAATLNASLVASITAVLFTIAISQPAFAAQCKPVKLNQGHCKTRDCPKFKVKTRNNIIDQTGTCSEYKQGSLQYRNCRVYAQKTFKASCKHYRKESKTKTSAQICADRFCGAEGLRP